MTTADDGRIFDGYARLYGALTLVALGLVFMPMFDDLRVVDLETGAVESRFGTLWETAARPNGGPAAVGMVLAFVLMGLFLAGTFRPRVGGLPVAIAVTCVPVILMLITKPATGEPEPDLSPAGVSSMAVAVFALVLGVAHAVHLVIWNRERTAAGRPLP